MARMAFKANAELNTPAVVREWAKENANLCYMPSCGDKPVCVLIINGLGAVYCDKHCDDMLKIINIFEMEYSIMSLDNITTENHLRRIFKEKPDTMFVDKYTRRVFTVDELCKKFLIPAIETDYEDLAKYVDWFSRYEKVNK